MKEVLATNEIPVEADLHKFMLYSELSFGTETTIGHRRFVEFYMSAPHSSNVKFAMKHPRLPDG